MPMGESSGVETRVRLLGLGNEILADDAFGIRAARAVARRFRGGIEVAVSSESGFNLLDHLLGAERLLVVDTIVTGRAKPGSLHIFEEGAFHPAPGVSPHFVGFFEVLAAARMLGLPVPRRVSIAAVEAADCLTVGGAMHPDVRAAIPAVTAWVAQSLEAAHA